MLGFLVFDRLPKPTATLLALAACWAGDPVAAAKPDGRLRLQAVDAETEQPLAVRLHLRGARDRAVRPPRGKHAWGVAALGDHVYFDGGGDLLLRRGVYRFDLTAGPEYRTQHGHFEIGRHADDSKQIEMTRVANLTDEGWSAADLATHRPAGDLDLLRRAEQLDHAVTIGAEWRDDAWREPKHALPPQREDKPPSGASALWDDPRGVVWLIDANASRSVEGLPEPGASSVAFLRSARDAGWRVLASITSAELPLWIAAEVVDAVVVIDGWSTDQGRRPDKLRYPGARGPGRWRRELYESLVDAGVRLPPVALSGSGLNETPIGNARVYAFTDGDTSPSAWWEAADELACVATNGPLLRPLVEGAPPGATFLLGSDGTRTLSIGLSLTTRVPVEYLEVVKDGEVAHNVRLAELAEAGGRLPTVTFDSPGWMTVVAVTEAEDRYRFAMSAPWFVEAAHSGRVDPTDTQAWLDALHEARARFGDTDPDAYAEAEAFWRDRHGGSSF